MRVAILTISDGCFHGHREDLSGQRLAELVQAQGWQIVHRQVVPDEVPAIQAALRALSSGQAAQLILTTGGTGLGPRDVTPEAVRGLVHREVPGMAELMRLRGLEKTPFAALSRSLAGVLKRSLLLCLPGSPKGALESLQAVLEILPHAVDLIEGRTRHGKGSREG